jgi:GNAT superfamily N-acetyltransferase
VTKTIPVKTSYLQMHRPPGERVPPPTEGIEVARVPRPEIGFYRSLYDAVGRDWNWINRKLMSDDELRAIIHHPRVDFHVLYVRGTPAGFCEMDRRVDGEVEIVYFGLAREFIGKGLGKHFLNRMLHEAWSHAPRRVWLHTCELDHEAALRTYQKAGLAVYDERVVMQKVL